MKQCEVKSTGRAFKVTVFSFDPQVQCVDGKHISANTGHHIAQCEYSYQKKKKKNKIREKLYVDNYVVQALNPSSVLKMNPKMVNKYVDPGINPT